MTRLVAGAALTAALAAPSSSQDRSTDHTLALSDTAARPAAAFEDVTWLVGAWGGPAMGGTADEVWLPAAGGAMTGSFRLVLEGGSPVLDLKHVHPDMTGWERRDETVRFPLAALEDGAALSDGLTYRHLGADVPEVWVAPRGDGVVEEERFVLCRHGLGGGVANPNRSRSP